jgi:hypothetical protein
MSSVNSVASPPPSVDYRDDDKTKVRKRDDAGIDDGPAPLSLSIGKTPPAAGDSDGIGVRGTNKPKLAAPEPMDMDTMAEYTAYVTADATEQQQKVQGESIKNKAEEKKATAAKAQKEHDDAVAAQKAAEEAAQKAKQANLVDAVLGMIGAVLGAIVACVFTGGLGIAAAVLSCALAAQNLANTSMAYAGTQTKDVLTGESKQMDISFGSLVNAIQEQNIATGAVVRVDDHGNALGADGHIMTAQEVQDALGKGAVLKTQDDLQKEAMGISMFIQMALVVATIVLGVAAAAGVGSVANAGKQVAQDASDVAEIADQASTTKATLGQLTEAAAATTDIGSGSAQIVAGRYGIEEADQTAKSGDSEAEGKFDDRVVKELTQQMQIQFKLLKRLAELMEDGYQKMSDSINGIDDTRTDVARNMEVSCIA